MTLTNMNVSNRLALCPLGLIYPWEIDKKISKPHKYRHIAIYKKMLSLDIEAHIVHATQLKLVML